MYIRKYRDLKNDLLTPAVQNESPVRKTGFYFYQKTAQKDAGKRRNR
jgi:hypothetical protein